MGKSDEILFPIYSKIVPRDEPIAILGGRNRFVFNGLEDIDVYDITGTDEFNWDINSDWTLRRDYRTIVCTRCVYFCKNPLFFLEKCASFLKEGGSLMFDSGLGDHWRFKTFRVGWKDDKEHEFAYGENNFLWSALWSDEIAAHDESKKFFGWCQAKYEKYRNITLSEIIFREVPSIFSLNDVLSVFGSLQWDALALWEESPQLYIFVVATK